YEIRIANVTNAHIALKRIAVVDRETDITIATLESETIGSRFSLGGSRGNETSQLGPFQFGVVFMHVTLERGTSHPATFVHIVECSSEQQKIDLSLRLAEISVIAKQPPSLGPLFRGNGYVAADGCCDSIRHVRALLPLNGSFYLSQRFAIDWER